MSISTYGPATVSARYVAAITANLKQHATRNTTRFPKPPIVLPAAPRSPRTMAHNFRRRISGNPQARQALPRKSAISNYAKRYTSPDDSSQPSQTIRSVSSTNSPSSNRSDESTAHQTNHEVGTLAPVEIIEPPRIPSYSREISSHTPTPQSPSFAAVRRSSRLRSDRPPSCIAVRW